MKKPENMAGKIAITAAAAYFGVAALLVAQTGSGTRVEPARAGRGASPRSSGGAVDAPQQRQRNADAVKYRAMRR